DFHNYVYNTDKDISSIIRPAIFVTPNKKIDELLKELQQQKSHIAFILDEYAGTMGLVTLEDIVEELVGEIWDEHDEIVQEIVQISENEYHVLGSADIEEVFEKFDISEEIDVMTASGWVMNVLGRIPNEGDSFVYKNLDVTVLSMDEKRVGKISIVVKENTEE
ncbi:MAG: CBS domain-containing protein, partial [Oscillospiraceae bacterium]|nr:CBS domain-containing protein [Oscillospiraceae bacterium]